MTRKELIVLIKPLKWVIYRSRLSPRIRTPDLACPILAAFAVKFPDEIMIYGNADWAFAAKRLKLPLRVAKSMVDDADQMAPRLLKELGLSE